ncbi:hypothetical protein KIPB_005793, partial [Kipferlia bialata]|eukprot:g5793.t1
MGHATVGAEKAKPPRLALLQREDLLNTIQAVTDGYEKACWALVLYVKGTTPNSSTMQLKTFGNDTIQLGLRMLVPKRCGFLYMMRPNRPLAVLIWMGSVAVRHNCMNTQDRSGSHEALAVHHAQSLTRQAGIAFAHTVVASDRKGGVPGSYEAVLQLPSKEQQKAEREAAKAAVLKEKSKKAKARKHAKERERDLARAKAAARAVAQASKAEEAEREREREREEQESELQLTPLPPRQTPAMRKKGSPVLTGSPSVKAPMMRQEPSASVSDTTKAKRRGRERERERERETTDAESRVRELERQLEREREKERERERERERLRELEQELEREKERHRASAAPASDTKTKSKGKGKSRISKPPTRARVVSPSLSMIGAVGTSGVTPVPVPTGVSNGARASAASPTLLGQRSPVYTNPVDTESEVVLDPLTARASDVDDIYLPDSAGSQVTERMLASAKAREKEREREQQLAKKGKRERERARRRERERERENKTPDGTEHSTPKKEKDRERERERDKKKRSSKRKSKAKLPTISLPAVSSSASASGVVVPPLNMDVSPLAAGSAEAGGILDSLGLMDVEKEDSQLLHLPTFKPTKPRKRAKMYTRTLTRKGVLRKTGDVDTSGSVDKEGPDQYSPANTNVGRPSVRSSMGFTSTTIIKPLPRDVSMMSLSLPPKKPSGLAILPAMQLIDDLSLRLVGDARGLSGYPEISRTVHTLADSLAPLKTCWSDAKVLSVVVRRAARAMGDSVESIMRSVSTCNSEKLPPLSGTASYTSLVEQLAPMLTGSLPTLVDLEAILLRIHKYQLWGKSSLHNKTPATTVLVQ